MFALILQLHGGDRILAKCEDGVERSCRITGKMKKRVWMRVNDVIIVKLWDIDPKQADTKFKYQGFQTEYLKRKGLLAGLPL